MKADLESLCGALALARMRAECLRAQTIVEAPHLSVAAWSHRSLALQQAGAYLNGAIYSVFDFKRELVVQEKLKALGF